MNKKYISMFAISSTFIVAFSVILFMIMLPQSINVSSENKYENIDEEEYTFKQTKDISEDSLSYEYKITSEDIENFKNTNRYKMGNDNPFYNEK